MVILLFVLTLFLLGASEVHYEPNWESLDSRPLPQWYDEAKIGLFMHWGVYSVPSFHSEWFWWYWQGDVKQEIVDFMKKNYAPNFQYSDFANQFKAEFFDPDEWAELISAAGVRYVVLTAKHHEGFSNWNTSFSFNWNSVQSGPGRDLVAELAQSIRKKNILFGVYHSLFEWFNPMFKDDLANNFSTNLYVKNKVLPQLKELVKKFEPAVVWSDGDWDSPVEYWDSMNFLSWLYNESPVKDYVVTNDRWGSGTACKHGGFFTCEDRYNPGKLQQKKWENCLTIDKKSWGHRREAKLQDILSIEDLIEQIVSTVSFGGNILINVGPTSYGKIDKIFEERLRQMGQWLAINGEAIYSTQPWPYQQTDTETKYVWYTSQKFAGKLFVYAHLLRAERLKETGFVKLNISNNNYEIGSVDLFTKKGPVQLDFKLDDTSSLIQVEIRLDKVIWALDWGWVFRISIKKS